MGKTQSTGNLTNALAQDSSNNIGIGGAVNASFKLQVTGATNLTSDLTVNGLTVGRGAGAIVSNTAVGLSALPVNTTGTLNTAIGNLALLTNTTGYGNTSVGYGAIGYNTTGFFNAAIGVNALLFNSTGTYNNALGTAALYANTTGSYNTAVGQQAGTANTTGSNNTYIGYSSGFNITTGSNNTIIGRYFGTAAMANNIVLADGAGNVRYQWDGTNNVFGNPISGTSASFSSSLTASSLVKSGGTSSQFLMADGSVNTSVLPSGAYLPLTGGTLTGALSGTSANFSSTVRPASNLGSDLGTSSFRWAEMWGYTLNLNGGSTIQSRLTLARGSDDSSQNALYGWNSIIVQRTSVPLSVAQTDFSIIQQGSDGSRTPFYISSGGNVGIGTSSPQSLLQVGNFSNNSILTLAADASSVSSIYFGDGTGAALYRGFVEYAHETDTMRIGTSSTERMRITSGGNVLIGTTSNPSNYKFVVSSNAWVPHYVAFGINDDGRYIGQGNIISGAFQSYDLTIVNYATSARVVIANGSNGVVLNNGATSWSAFSDERLKNVNGSIENAVEKLLSIRAVKYSWKTDETNKENLGLIAQDVEKVFPQVVDESKSFSETDDTKYLSLRYTELIPVLVKAIQELKLEIEELKNK